MGMIEAKGAKLWIEDRGQWRAIGGYVEVPALPPLTGEKPICEHRWGPFGRAPWTGQHG